ncbi:DUF6482 family protein [Carnimonas bestiolae]|uniref:DUF6482 family protein n=1 Tax=Carnimonas bestiolae TaxID=3402172 RepID=UPI003EDBFEA5
MEIEQLKRYPQPDVEPTIVTSTGLHLYQIELMHNQRMVGRLLKRGRPLMFRSLDGASQTLRTLGFKHAWLTEQNEDRDRNTGTSLQL